MQSRIESFIETFADIGSGFIIAWLLLMFLEPIYNMADPSDAFIVTCYFTGVSLIRRYFTRRIFNHYIKRRKSIADI